MINQERRWFSLSRMKSEPAINPAFCMHSLSLKLFNLIYLKSVCQPARDSPHPPDSGRSVPGHSDHSCGALVPGALSCKFPLSLDEERIEGKGTNEGTIS